MPPRSNRLSRPAQVDEQAGDDLLRARVVAAEEQCRRSGQRARVGDHHGGDAVGCLDDLDVREGFLDAAAEAVVRDHQREVGVGGVGDVPSTVPLSLSAPIEASSGIVSTPDGVDHDIGADDGVCRGGDGCGESAAVCRIGSR